MCTPDDRRSLGTTQRVYRSIRSTIVDVHTRHSDTLYPDYRRSLGTALRVYRSTRSTIAEDARIHNSTRRAIYDRRRVRIHRSTARLTV